MASTDISLFAYEAADQKKEKSPNALRTISEASDILDVPQHVLRFWETKFTQIKPLKRNGGRRFYRPQDIDILQQIKHLLYNQGYTIKGAKKAVDDFISARGADRAVTHDDWIAAIPPASVNDNFVAPIVSLVEPSAVTVTASDESDLLAELAHALTEEPVTDEPSIARESLEELRTELLAMREALLLHLPAASPIYQ